MSESKITKAEREDVQESMESMNGDRKVILLRLQTLEEDVKSIKATINQVRDFQLSHPLCPKPGSCLELATELVSMRRDHERELRMIQEAMDGIKTRVWIGIGIVSTLAVVMPVILRHLLSGV